MTRYALFPALAALLAAAPALAQDLVTLPPICGVAEAGDAHAGHGAPAADAHAGHGAASEPDAHAALREGMDAMHAQMSAAMAAEDFDVAFVCGMIPHHQGAIVMARAALTHSEDPFVLGLAGEIVAAQEAEIAAMRDWLDARD